MAEVAATQQPNDSAEEGDIEELFILVLTILIAVLLLLITNHRYNFHY